VTFLVIAIFLNSKVGDETFSKFVDITGDCREMDMI